MTKRKVNIYKPRIRKTPYDGNMQWECSSFISHHWGANPEEAYNKWKEKELECSGKQRMENMVDNSLKSLKKHQQEVEVVEWDIRGSHLKPNEPSLPNTHNLVSKVIKWFKGYL